MGPTRRPPRGRHRHSPGGDLSPRYFDLLLDHPELADLDAAARRRAIQALVTSTGVDDAVSAAAELADFVDEFGPLTRLMQDERVTDVLVNGPDDVWIERGGSLERTDVSFASAAELRALVDWLVSKAGARVDASRPIADARLADGSRLHVVVPPAAPDGPIVSIRRFAGTSPRLADMTAAGWIEPGQREALTAIVAERKNVVIAGATGTGKTTLLNALVGEVPHDQRVVTIEETRELRVRAGHVVSLVARVANAEGSGRVELHRLLRASLRMRPDRIVVGEVRGPEAMVALSAFSTGHEGSMVTVHARSADDVPGRLVSLALEAPSAPPERSLELQVRSAFDAIVFLARRDRRRVIESIRAL